MSSMQNKNVNTRSERDGGRHTFPINHRGFNHTCLAVSLPPSLEKLFLLPASLPLSLLLFLPFSLVLNYLEALSVFIYLSKVHVQYACTNFLLGEREPLSGAWRLTTPAAVKEVEERGGERKGEEGRRNRLEV